ncbi:hypothetical protein GCM10011374_10980 [Kocuria dechangensis]|uniref:General stress protein 17M-like domain-containing protein n=1 Tax=Kocuria dechangensis TaxID=1176249 RepID=A0A917GLC7_9MICC|nr:hypothetical protein GCM10011374_10980 [Kocuria dechangensis]
MIGRYASYADAQKAVDHLADEQFEVDKVAIVGNDLKSVEQVTGRLSYPKVAGQGALNGMVFGAFLGMIMSLLGGEQWVSSLLVSVLMGGAFWMLLATVTYATQRGKRDFTSTNQIVATSYDVVAAPEVAQRARQVLQGPHGVPGLPAQPPPPPHAGAPGPGGPTAPGAPWQRPSYGTPGQQPAPGPVPGARPAEPPTRSATFQDLPDGRPQYGIRLDEEEEAPPEAPRPAGVPGSRTPESRAPEPRAPGQEPPAGGSSPAPR